MPKQAAAALEIASAIAKTAATIAATSQKIKEAKADYRSEIARMEEMKAAREATAEAEIGRGKEIGIEALTELAAGTTYETRKATFEAEQTASSAEAKLGASGLRASGSALAARQQDVDIAYATADRTAEAGAAQMKVGGLQVASQLKGAREQKTLLGLEYGQSIEEQRRKLTELEDIDWKLIRWAGLGALGAVTSSFYKHAEAGTFKKA